MRAKELLQTAVRTVAVPALLGVERLQSGVAFNPLAKSFRVDPYPQYRALQSRDPFHRSKLANSYVLTRYADINAILKDKRFVSDQRKHPDYERRRAEMVKSGALPEDAVDTPSMLTLDPPDHTRLRSLVSKAFTPRAVEALRPRVEEIVRTELDRVSDAGEMDVIEDLAYPLPVTVIAEMLGVPAEDREQFKRWSDEVILGLGIGLTDNVQRSRAASQELTHYFERIVEERRREPREDLLSALLVAEEEGDKLSMDEVYSTCILLLVAGHETTTNLIGNGLLALLRHPDQLDALRNNPELIESAVEELLRYDSPVQLTGRFSLEDAEIGGHTIEAGREAILLLGAANRDPKRFNDPDRLDITREDNNHLSFSQGIHSCLGAPLARIEGQAALLALAERFPNVRLATESVVWGDNLVLRGLKALPVTF